MTGIKKLLLFIVLAVVMLVVAGCGTKDEVAPTLTVGNDEITHAVDATIDIIALADVTVSDDVTPVAEIVVTIKNYGGYDKSVAGTYTVTISAKDAAGNEATAEVTVIVSGDMLAPTLVGTVSTINHLAGEEVDVTRNINAVDNVDGTNVIINVHSLGTYNKDVPGTYTISLTLEDSAGNVGAPFNRTIVVSASYTRAEMTSFEDEIVRYKALYNPQVFNGNTGTGFNTAYDGHYVNVLSKEYVEWLLEFAPERIGAGVGWSVIAVTDSDDKIVYVRHWNSGEAYLDTEQELTSVHAENWSTGTVRTWTELVGEQVVGRSNAKYSSAEMGLMMANINEWIPEDGHVFIFLNWSTIKEDGDNVVLKQNESDMPRSMGGNYIMNSDEDGDDIMDYALGRELKIIDPELSHEDVRFSFDSTNPFPIITIPSQKYITDTGVWRERYTEMVYLNEYNTENPYNPLRGIIANDGKGINITGDVTYKVYRYSTTLAQYNLSPSLPLTSPLWADYFETVWEKSANEVTIEQALVPANNDMHFVVEYQVTANGHTDTAYKLIQIKAQTPDYVELYGDTDTVYSLAMGLQQRLELNPNLVDFGAMDQTERGIVYDGHTFVNAITLPALEKGVAVVLDEFFRIRHIRVLNGEQFEIDAMGQVTSVSLSWSNDDLLEGLDGFIAPSDYVLVYPEGLNDVVINRALRAFYNYDFSNGEITEINFTNGIVEVKLPIKEVQEVNSLMINDEVAKITMSGNEYNVEAVVNNRTSLVFNPAGGANFRLSNGKIYYYDKAMLVNFLQDSEVVNSFTTASPNHGLPWLNNGVIMIFDDAGDFVVARLMVGAAAEVHADGTTIFGADNLTWDLVLPNTANTESHGGFKNILDQVPENGSIIIFPTTSGTTAVRDLAIKMLWNEDYPAGGAIVNKDEDPVPATVATHGFDADTFNAAYFAELEIGISSVSTVVDKPTKIMRPVVTLSGYTLTWGHRTNAASYDLYFDGAKVATNIGELAEDTVTFDLSSITIEEGVYDVQVRAITGASETIATSVLSDAVVFEVNRLAPPSNVALNDNLLTWDDVTGATKYLVKVDTEEYVEVESNSYEIPDEFLVDGTEVLIVAAGSETLFDSLPTSYILSIEVIPKQIVLGNSVLPIVEFTVSSWMRHASWDPGAQQISGIVAINGAEKIQQLADTDIIFSGGYAAILDSEMNVKYIVDRWAHEWNATDGWTTHPDGWPYGATLYASYFKPHLAEGDILVAASQWSGGLTEGTYRNHFGNALIKDLGTVTTDHRNVVLAEAIDPSTVDVVIEEIIMTKTISLGLNDLNLVEFELSKWLHYIDPTGGNDVGAQWVKGIIMVHGAYGITELADTDKVFAGGYAAILDADMKVKYIVDRWAHEWNATDGWTTHPDGWPYGATLYASYFKPHLAEGDTLILASQYGTGLPAGTYRNYFGNALIKDLGTVGTDHRDVVLTEAIDPTTRTITIKESVEVLVVGKAVVDVRQFTLTEWENYIDPEGGNNIGANFLPGMIIVNGANGISEWAADKTIINGGYLAVLDSDMKVKYFVDRWAHEWNATDGWTTNAGAWPWALNIKASYIQEYLEEGDMLLMASQYGMGLVPNATYRDVLGNQLLVDLGVAIYTGDHRNAELTGAIDPSTVSISLVQLG